MNDNGRLNCSVPLEFLRNWAEFCLARGNLLLYEKSTGQTTTTMALCKLGSFVAHVLGSFFLFRVVVRVYNI